MRILFQYLSGGGGGLSNIIMLLAAYAREFPCDEVIVVCEHGSDLEQLSSLSNIRIVPITTNHVKEWARFKLGTYQLQSLVDVYRPDIVWSLNLGAYRKLSVPNLLAVHNPHQVYPWSVTRLHPRPWWRVALLRYFFQRSLAVADAVLLQTPLMAAYISNISGVPKRRFVIPKAVESDEDVCDAALPSALLDRISNARARGCSVWLYVGTALPHKNHAMILRAFDELAQREANECLVLTISASEAEAIGGPKVAALIASGHLITAGWISKEHLRALYGACDACVFPSLLESLSSANLEAMEWGKPQIVSDLAFARDTCDDAALYVAADSPVAWADAIENLSRNEPMRDLLIARGKQRILEFPSTWSQCAQRFRGCITSLLSEHSSLRC